MRRILSVAMAVAMSSGCSVAFVKGPSDSAVAGTGYVDECDEDAASPYIDLSTAILFALPAVVYAQHASERSESSSGDDEWAAAGISAGLTVAYAVASYVGFSRMERCRQAMTAYRMQVQRPVMVPGGPPGATPPAP